MEEFRILPQPLLTAISVIGGCKLREKISWLTESLDREVIDLLTCATGAKPKSLLRRITSIPDKEMKTRIIANLDY